MKHYKNYLVLSAVLLCTMSAYAMDSSNETTKPVEIVNKSVGWKRNSIDKQKNLIDDKHQFNVWQDYPGSSSPVITFPIYNNLNSTSFDTEKGQGCCP